MALCFLEAFAGVADVTALAAKQWALDSSPTTYLDIDPTGGPNGQPALKGIANSSAFDFRGRSFAVSDPTHVRFGFYFKTDSFDDLTTWVGSRNLGGQLHAGLRLKSDGSIDIVNRTGATEASSAAGVITINTWYAIEVEISGCATASASVDVHVDGSSVVSATGVDANSSGGMEFLAFRASQSICYYADLYVQDLSVGSGLDEWLYPWTTDILDPAADGSESDWTPDGSPATDHYELVRDSADDEGSYLRASGGTGQETFTFDPLSVYPDRIFGLILLPYGRSDGSGQVQARVKSGGSTWNSSSVLWGSSFDFVRYNIDGDPNAGSPVGEFTQTTLNAAEFGCELVNGAASLSSLWLEVLRSEGTGSPAGGGTPGGGSDLTQLVVAT